MKHSHRGFAIGAVLMAIVLLAVVAGAIAMANRGGSNSTAEQTAKVNAAAIVQESINLRQGFDIVLGRGTSASAITFDAAANTGLFNPTTGGAQVQTVPSSAQSVAQAWVYKPANVKLVGVGVTATADYVVAVGGIKDSVCQQINQALYSSTTIPASGVAETAWTTAATAVDLSAGITGIDNRSDVCVSTTTGADHNVYYTVVIPQ